MNYLEGKPRQSLECGVDLDGQSFSTINKGIRTINEEYFQPSNLIEGSWGIHFLASFLGMMLRTCSRNLLKHEVATNYVVDTRNATFRKRHSLFFAKKRTETQQPNKRQLDETPNYFCIQVSNMPLGLYFH